MLHGVEIHPGVCHGKPVLKGTRVLVSTVLGALAGGDSASMVAEDYDITAAQVSAALAFAAAVADAPTHAYDEVA